MLRKYSHEFNEDLSSILERKNESDHGIG